MDFVQAPPPRQPFFRAPPVVPGLIAVLAVAHGIRKLLPGEGGAGVIQAYALIPARYSRAFLTSHMVDPGTVWQQALPFVSYMGLHNDIVHLAINCLWLLAFGPIVARRLGAVLFLLFFIVCGVAGAMTYVAFNWGSDVPVIGASGAISGLMAAALRMLPGHEPQARLAPIFSRQILLFSAVWAGINLLTGITGLGMAGQNGLVAWQAHLGGFVAGLLLCAPFDRLKSGKKPE